MTTWNPIVIQTGDHGPAETLCPSWCTGDEHPDGCDRATIVHTGEPVSITVQLEGGSVELAWLRLSQSPFTEQAPHDVQIVLCLVDDGSWPTDAPEVDRLASELVNAGRRLRPAFRALDALRDGEQR